MDYTILVQSAVVATAISGILGALQSLRSKAYIYRSNERAVWRKEMRDSIILLSASGKRNLYSADVDCALAQIRSHINPYGYSSDALIADSQQISDKHVLSETHIWMAINSFEKQKNHENLHFLTHYLDLLLKFDEERSKSDEQISVFFFVAFVSALIGGFFLFQVPDMREITNPRIFVWFIVLYSMASLGICLLMLNLRNYTWKQVWIGIVFFLVLYSVLIISVVMQSSVKLYDVVASTCFILTFIASISSGFGIQLKIKNEYVKAIRSCRPASQSKDKIEKETVEKTTASI